jgi:hydroxymethylpyrimidine/phosphomethylpyrimidine kinase
VTRAKPAGSCPVALTIAGSDNSSGAGIQADLKTFGRFGCYGLTAVTCVVAEVPGRVAAIQAIRAAIVAEQVRLSFSAFPVTALKTGMLFSTAILTAVADALAAAPPGCAVVVDPVMVASSGDPLLRPAAVAAYRKRIFPRATVVTPNLDELAVLAGRPLRSVAAMREAGRALVDEFGCAFLVKGGHLRGRTAVDLLLSPAGEQEFAAPFVRGVETHGTGCTYSAAITAGLAAGQTLERAVSEAKDFVTAAISDGLRWGRTGALNHRAGSLSPQNSRCGAFRRGCGH